MRKNKSAFLLPLAAAILPFFTLGYDMGAIGWAHRLQASKPPAYLAFHFISPFIDMIGYGGWQIGIIAGLFAVGLFTGRRLRRLGLALFVSFISSGVGVQMLKHLIGRARPRKDMGVFFAGPSFKGGFDSFPSGHTMVAFCLAYTLARFFPKYSPLFYLIAVMVAVERVLLLAHFPTDVLVGALLGLFTGRMIFELWIKEPENYLNLG
ncbi:MAG: phosphatase PAP2 family protein [Nitrospiraceae bacterium]|nr:phosphatase PAP2 family protein [Nitrospiraceae bacterium]